MQLRLSMTYVALFAAVLGLASCASKPEQVVVEQPPTVQVISVNTPGVVGAHCFLQAGGMSYPVAAPGRVAVRKSGKAMDVTCFKGEHMVGNTKLSPLCSGDGCGYPANVTIAMVLDSSSMKRDVVHFFP